MPRWLTYRVDIVTRRGCALALRHVMTPARLPHPVPRIRAGLGFHSLRRRFVNDLKSTKLRDLCGQEKATLQKENPGEAIGSDGISSYQRIG